MIATTTTTKITITRTTERLTATASNELGYRQEIGFITAHGDYSDYVNAEQWAEELALGRESVPVEIAF